MNKIFSKYLVITTLITLGACNFLGRKVDKSFIDVPSYDKDDIAFVPILPFFTGFVNPVKVIVGWDELIYVADAGTQELLCLDLSGKILSRKSIPGIRSVAQNRNLDLFVIGSVSKTINGTPFELSAIYRIDPKSATYGLNNAIMKDTIIHPFYFKSSLSAFNSNDASVLFESIAVLGDNTFYVVRSGPNNDVSQLGGPNDAILYFSKDGQFLSNVDLTTGSGLKSDFFVDPKSIVGLAQPPQGTNISTLGNFVYTSTAPDRTLKVLGINRLDSDFGSEYVLSFAPQDTSKAKRYLYTPGLFSSPADVALSGDGRNYLFVADQLKDSIFQFQSLTYAEGITPPNGSSAKKNIVVSFGGKGAGVRQFDKPSSVFYYNKMLYVAEKGNARISRYKLTSDIL